MPGALGSNYRYVIKPLDIARRQGSLYQDASTSYNQGQQLFSHDPGQTYGTDNLHAGHCPMGGASLPRTLEVPTTVSTVHYAKTRSESASATVSQDEPVLMDQSIKFEPGKTLLDPQYSTSLHGCQFTGMGSDLRESGHPGHVVCSGILHAHPSPRAQGNSPGLDAFSSPPVGKA